MLSFVLSIFISISFYYPVFSKNDNQIQKTIVVSNSDIINEIDESKENEFNQANYTYSENLISSSTNESQEDYINQIDKLNKNLQEVPSENPWQLIIPKIDLNAPIEEGTSAEVLDRSIGHFENTSMYEGTVALCAHNRGYQVNYFSNLHLLMPNDVIYYQSEIGSRIYHVTEQKIISNEDWSYMEASEENKLILITCVANEPNLRRIIICMENEM